jgi:uncharacterized GH25 family protein
MEISKMALRMPGAALLFAVLNLTAIGIACAHSPYLLPNAFDATNRKLVTVQGSFTEEFFVPDVAMKSDDYHVIAPDGSKSLLKPIYTQDLAILEAPLTAPGTYRISTGQRMGRMSKAMLVDGKWEFLDPQKPAPKQGKIFDVRSITMADVFVSRGAPTDTALAPAKKGLEFRPLMHPNKLFAGSEVRFEVLFEGKPLAKQPVGVHFGDERYSDKKIYAEAVTDASGIFSVKLDKPGVYLAMSRYRVEPEASGGAAASYTYSITFEATD